jgi:ABC-type phosphate transport system substrate-binding protein
MIIFRPTILLLLVGLLLVLPALAMADTAVIVNSANTNQVDEQFIQKAFLGSVGRWPSRANIVLVELPETNPETINFYNKLLHKSPAAVRDIWAANYFTGKASPPKQGASDDEVKRQVAANKNAIGFIHAGSVDGTVRVILTLR